MGEKKGTEGNVSDFDEAGGGSFGLVNALPSEKKGKWGPG